MNEPTMEPLARRLDRVEREEGGRTAMRIVLIVAVLLLAGCSEDVGRYQAFKFPYILDTRTGCVLRLVEVKHNLRDGHGHKEGNGWPLITWELSPMNRSQCKT